MHIPKLFITLAVKQKDEDLRPKKPFSKRRKLEEEDDIDLSGGNWRKLIEDEDTDIDLDRQKD